MPAGAQAGPVRVTIDPGGPGERDTGGLTDAEPVRAGEVIRIRTTGGGGWGDPLRRDPALVAADVRDGKVSARGALVDHGVVLGDPAATAAERARLRAEREEVPFIDRGPGYARLAGSLESPLDRL